MGHRFRGFLKGMAGSAGTRMVGQPQSEVGRGGEVCGGKVGRRDGGSVKRYRQRGRKVTSV